MPARVVCVLSDRQPCVGVTPPSVNPLRLLEARGPWPLAMSLFMRLAAHPFYGMQSALPVSLSPAG